MPRTWSLLTLMIPALLLAEGCGRDEPAWEVRPIPMEDFFRNPERVAPILSPDGNHLAFLSPWNNRLNIHVQDLKGGDPIRITDSAERDIQSFGWGNSSRLIYVRDVQGDENYRVFAVDLDGGNELELTPFSNVRTGVVDFLRGNDREILILMNRRDPRVFDVYRADLYTGELSLEAENPGSVSEWITDHDGCLRAAMATEGASRKLLYREDKNSPFRETAVTNFTDAIEPSWFTPDNRYLYVSSNIDRDKKAVFKFDPATGRNVELVYEHPDVDVSTVLYSPLRRDIVGVAYVTDRLRQHFFDPEVQSFTDSLRARLPGYTLSYISLSQDERRLVILAQSDRQPGRYFLYDRSTGELRALFDTFPWLSESEMAQVTPIQYLSRDGLMIHGYLTLPVGIRPEKLPVVVRPHGGPWTRDIWQMDPTVQFLANRGYAVLQMNYRGSTGYGRSFFQASFREWGDAVQEDIADGVRWLIREGIADPERIAIYGSSFGGYCALLSAARFPELYKCAASYVGIPDLLAWISSIPPYWELDRALIYEAMGNPERDRALIEAHSPITYAADYRVPLFLAHGANDPRIPREASDRFVEAVRGQGLEVEYLVKEDEGHGFTKEENRFELHRRLEQFLDRHIGGRTG